MLPTNWPVPVQQRLGLPFQPAPLHWTTCSPPVRASEKSSYEVCEFLRQRGQATLLPSGQYSSSHWLHCWTVPPAGHAAHRVERVRHTEPRGASRSAERIRSVQAGLGAVRVVRSAGRRNGIRRKPFRHLPGTSLLTVKQNAMLHHGALVLGTPIAGPYADSPCRTAPHLSCMAGLIPPPVPWPAGLPLHLQLQQVLSSGARHTHLRQHHGGFGCHCLSRACTAASGAPSTNLAPGPCFNRT